MKKQPIIILSILFLLLFSINSCKKGENDPFVSLSSRNARLIGTWELQQSDVLGHYEGEFYEEPYYSLQTFDGTILSTTESNDDTTYTYSYSQEIIFNEDGIFNISTTKDNQTNTMSDSWWWIDSDKNKTGIGFGNYYYEDDFMEIDYNKLYINKLSSDELVLEQNMEIKALEDADSIKYVYSAIYKFSKKK